MHSPLLPHPLETEIAHVDRKPRFDPPDHLAVQTLIATAAQPREHPSHRPSDRWCDGVRAQFAQLRDHAAVVQERDGRFGQHQHRVEQCRNDKRF